jgi:hypothetical protein
VSLRIIYEVLPIDQGAGFLADDPEGLGEAIAAIDRLADDPRPPEAFPYGSSGLYRLRVGRYRVFYEIRSEEISITHIDRIGRPVSDP